MPKVSAQFRDDVSDQLSGLGGLDCRAMFGGNGVCLIERNNSHICRALYLLSALSLIRVISRR
jgi:hypothetical protein